MIQHVRALFDIYPCQTRVQRELRAGARPAPGSPARFGHLPVEGDGGERTRQAERGARHPGPHSLLGALVTACTESDLVISNLRIPKVFEIFDSQAPRFDFREYELDTPSSAVTDYRTAFVLIFVRARVAELLFLRIIPQIEGSSEYFFLNTGAYDAAVFLNEPVVQRRSHF